MIYKGHDLDEWIAVLRSLKRTQVDPTHFTNGAIKALNRFFTREGYPEFRTVYLLAVSEAWQTAFVNDAKRTIQEGGELTGFFGEVNEFVTAVGETTGVNIAFPVLDVIATGFDLFSTIIGIFGTEARTKSFNMKEDIKTKLRQIENTSVHTFYFVEQSFHTNLLGQEKNRPACRSGSEACGKEHLEYVARCQIMLEAQDSVFQIVMQYFNEANFKTFIDDYDLVKQQMIGMPVGGGGFGGNGGNGKGNGGCLGMALALISGASLLGYLAISLFA